MIKPRHNYDGKPKILQDKTFQDKTQTVSPT